MECRHEHSVLSASVSRQKPFSNISCENDQVGIMCLGKEKDCFDFELQSDAT